MMPSLSLFSRLTDSIISARYITADKKDNSSFGYFIRTPDLPQLCMAFFVCSSDDLFINIIFSCCLRLPLSHILFLLKIWTFFSILPVYTSRFSLYLSLPSSLSLSAFCFDVERVWHMANMDRDAATKRKMDPMWAIGIILLVWKIESIILCFRYFQK